MPMRAWWGVILVLASAPLAGASSLGCQVAFLLCDEPPPRNLDFEGCTGCPVLSSVPDFWSILFGAAGQETTSAVDGRASLRLDCTTDTVVLSEPFPAPPGHYRIESWSKAIGAGVGVGIAFYDAAGEISAQLPATERQGAAWAFTVDEGDFPDADHARIWTLCAPYETGASANVDAIRLTRPRG